MKCPQCGTLLAANARFCNVCGASIPMQAENTFSKGGSVDTDATLLAPWSDVQSAQKTQLGTPQSAPSPRFGGMSPEQAGTFQQTQQGGARPQQPTFQAQAGGGWSQQSTAQAQAGGNWSQQQPPQAWTQLQAGADARPNNVGRPDRSKRRKGGCLRVLLILVIVLAVLVGSLLGCWFLFIRPSIHDQAVSQLNQAVNQAGNNPLVHLALLPFSGPGPKFPMIVSEDGINTYLLTQNSDQVKNLHVTITPDDLRLDFQAYGFDCTILAKPIESGGTLQVTNVQVQGVLSLVMSNDELTTALNTDFQTLEQNLGLSGRIQSVKLNDHEMDIQIS